MHQPIIPMATAFAQPASADSDSRTAVADVASELYCEVMQKRLPTFSGSRRGNHDGRLLVWLTCFVVFPLPMPTMHRHDHIQSPQSLQVHLTQQHHAASLESLPIDEPHWHLVMPSPSRGDGHDDDGHPHPPTDYVASHVGGSGTGMTVATGWVERWGSSSIWIFAALVPPSGTLVALNESSTMRVKSALQRQRSAHCCVMRC